MREDPTFCFDGLPAGTYRVGAWQYHGRAGLSPPIELLEGDRLEGVKLTLERSAGVSVRPVDARSGEPLPEAELEVYLEGVLAFERPRRDEDGLPWSGPMPPGHHFLVLTAEGYLPARWCVDHPGSAAQVEVPLVRASTLAVDLLGAREASTVAVSVLEGRDPGWESRTEEASRPLAFLSFDPGEAGTEPGRLTLGAGRSRLLFEAARAADSPEETYPLRSPLLRQEVEVDAREGEEVAVRLELPRD